jgi:hypothetical protein
MDDMKDEEFEILLRRAGLSLTDEEKGWVRPLFEVYLRHLKVLHFFDLEGHEVLTGFFPSTVAPPEVDAG